jgi:putative Mg2+ transporter-C (MgtC) family protein
MAGLGGIVSDYFQRDPTIPHLLLAVMLGAFIGVERQWRQRNAGLRTHTLVCLGAASFVDLAATLSNGPGGTLQVVAYVVSGVGFLGAGTIMKEGANIRGLNTAATLWCSAAVGASAAAGEVVTATSTCALVIFVNLFLRRIVRSIDTRGAVVMAPERETEFSFRLAATAAAEAHLRALLLHGFKEAGLSLRALESVDVEGRAGIVEVRAELSGPSGDAAAQLERIAGRLSLEPAVSAVRWKIAGSTDDGG